MAIEIRDAVKKYGRGESEICALDHVNLRIEKGEVCVILGPSGSGKSTLLNMIGGLDRLDAGTVTVEGVELAKQNRKELTEYRRKNVGVVFQSYNLIAELTVQENIRVVADIAEHPLALAELMEDLGLSRHAKHFPSELSGGQQQRCAIGRALIKNPSLLLCDEPTGALDSKTSRDILMLLEDINRQYGTTMLIVTHNNSIKNMVHQVIMIKDGQISKNYRNEKRVPAAELEDL
mgnify:CR=1 FL=1